MFKQVLPKKTQETLEILSRENIIRDFYLSGGTALVLYLGHRISQDLDFFMDAPFEVQILRDALKFLGPIKIFSQAKNTLHCSFNQTRLSFLRYNYSLLKPFTKFDGISISSLIDVLCTKLDTVSTRGSKKDFLDLCFAVKMKRFSLLEIIQAFKRKYKGIDYSLLHILKGLLYFEDADREQMPKMLKKTRWRDVKEFFRQEVRKMEKNYD